jgi:hypothetical protein
MLELPQITLIALTGKDIEGHQKALDYSCRGINFGAVKLVEKHSASIDEWSKTIFYDLGDYVDTEYALLIHNNGFIVHPEMWRDEWLQYSFAGSPFPLPSESDLLSYRDINGEIQRVGNSVGLRSKKLLDLPKKLNIEWRSFHGYYNEDGAIAINYRHIFEENGCKFMPLEEAIYFGRENEITENKDIENTFVFHNYLGRNAIYKDL